MSINNASLKQQWCYLHARVCMCCCFSWHLKWYNTALLSTKSVLVVLIIHLHWPSCRWTFVNFVFVGGFPIFQSPQNSCFQSEDEFFFTTWCLEVLVIGWLTDGGGLSFPYQVSVVPMRDVTHGRPDLWSWWTVRIQPTSLYVLKTPVGTGLCTSSFTRSFLLTRIYKCIRDV